MKDLTCRVTMFGSPCMIVSKGRSCPVQRDGSGRETRSLPKDNSESFPRGSGSSAPNLPALRTRKDLFVAFTYD